LTAEQWRQDLEFFANEITTKHRDPFHFISKAEFDQAASNLRQLIPSMKDSGSRSPVVRRSVA
jgi:hypothetical protein